MHGEGRQGNIRIPSSPVAEVEAIIPPIFQDGHNGNISDGLQDDAILKVGTLL